MTIQVLGTFINSYQKTFGQNFITDDFFFVYVGLASNILNGSSRMVWGKLYDIKGFKVSIENIFEYYLLYLGMHGLRTPRESFFSKTSNLWAWADILGWNFLGHLGYFRPDYQHPFWYCEFLFHVFHYFNHYFYKKTEPLHPTIYLGVGFEFGPQRIWDLAFVCP